ncbi:hypothetical protein [Glutamicibacter arilaitensis]|uniref:hypothetical protein n=1 Tax=Glutamicibacter arilaitensis TaxID=256701 RepID=UPI003F92DE1E
MNNFSKNDRVAFAFDKTTIGTVTRSTKAETRVLWDSGHETPVDPAELVHTTQIQPPAGFRTFTETDNDGNDFQTTQGPEEWTGDIQVSSHWSVPNGIEFFVHNQRHESGFIFNREELEEIPGMIKSVLETIDLARIADEHNLKVTGVFAVYEVRYKAELNAARINRQGGADDA